MNANEEIAEAGFKVKVKPPALKDKVRRPLDV